MWVVIFPMLNEGTTGTAEALLAESSRALKRRKYFTGAPSSVQIAFDVGLDDEIALGVGHAQECIALLELLVVQE